MVFKNSKKEMKQNSSIGTKGNTTKQVPSPEMGNDEVQGRGQIAVT